MKPFKTIDDQIKLLQERGLTVNQIEKAKTYLLQNNYYNVVNVYGKYFQNNNHYIHGASFEEIRAVHIFDSEYKSTMFKYLQQSEKHFKAIVAYRFSELYKDISYAYLKTNSYSSEKLLNLSKTISAISFVLNENIQSKENNAIKHYHKNHGDVPLWVVINYLTFGQVVFLYSHLDNKLKNKIAKDLAEFLSENAGKQLVLESKELQNILFNMVETRNCVAHNNLLLNFKCRNNIKYINGIHDFYNLEKSGSRQDVFNVMISLRCFLTKNQYAGLHNTVRKRIRTLNNKLQCISCNEVTDSLGFPCDWHNKVSKLEQE